MVKLTFLGWSIASAGATAFHLTPPELTIILGLIGAIVPLGIAYITERGRRNPHPGGESLEECRRENAKLRRQLRQMKAELDDQ